MVGVKGLVDSGISSVPGEFETQGVQDALEFGAAALPVVDLSQEKTRIVQALDSACRDWGTFQLVHHGIPDEVLNKMNRVVRGFFSLPQQERMAFYSEDKSKRFRFSSSFQRADGSPRQWYDYLYHVCNPPLKPEEVPDNVPEYWKAMIEYTEAFSALARKLYGYFSESLGLPADALEKVIGDPRYVLRANYFPPCPNPSKAIGIDQHTDSLCLTILQQDRVPGLQLFHDEKWMTVLPMDGALTVNIGDQMEILSNGIYRSPLHRAFVNLEPRVSIASFFGPNLDAEIGPLKTPSALTPRYKSCRSRDYIQLHGHSVFTNKTAVQKMRITEAET